jgi:hypothetical protein
LVPAQIAPEGFADIAIEGVTLAFTVTARLIVAVTGLAHPALLVIVHTMLLFPVFNVELE